MKLGRSTISRAQLGVWGKGSSISRCETALWFPRRLFSSSEQLPSDARNPNPLGAQAAATPSSEKTDPPTNGEVEDDPTRREYTSEDLARMRGVCFDYVYTIKPANWASLPAGWKVNKDATKARKMFDFGAVPASCHWMGRVMLLANKLECYPEYDWFFQGIEVTIETTAVAETLALYMNDQESRHAMYKNMSEQTAANENICWDDEYVQAIQQQAEGDFGWIVSNDRGNTNQFTGETYLQWMHRADFLVHRKSRDKRELRQNLTLDQLISESQQRKRRVERREGKEKLAKEMKEKMANPTLKLRTLASYGPTGALDKRTDKKEAVGSSRNNTRSMPIGALTGMGSERPARAVREDEDGPTIINDVLPREVRDQLNQDSDGMEDVCSSRVLASGARSQRMRWG
jgi:hypothetical protein